MAGMQDEFEFLLVDGSGSQQGGFHARLEPRRDLPLRFVKPFYGFKGMLSALVLTVAQGDHAMDDIAFPERKHTGNLPIGKTHPAGIQAQGLCQEDKFLALEAHLFFPILPLRSGHHQVIPDPGELTVRGDEQAGESLGLIEYELDIQS